MRNSIKMGAAVRSAKPMPDGEQWVMLKLHGTGSNFTVRDQFGTLPDKTVQGTTTNIWTDTVNGLVFSGDNHVEYSAEEAAILNLAGFAGRLLIAFDLAPIANGTTSSAEYTFGFGRFLNTGASSANGSIYGVYTTTRVPQLKYREQASADGGLSDQTFAGGAYSGDGTNPVRTHLAWLMDFNPDTPTVTRYVNGLSVGSAVLALNGIGRFTPNASYDKLIIGKRHYGSTANAPDSGLGSATPNATGIRMNNFTIVRSDDMTTTRAAEIVQSLHRFKGERP
jgi:hypothetical protein